jgi:hypothetical protein
MCAAGGMGAAAIFVAEPSEPGFDDFSPFPGGEW